MGVERPGPGRGLIPLTRGKPRRMGTTPRPRGLIPAHAGKTPTARLSPPCSRAHPRSRGENIVFVSVIAASRGSSPLTRGKPTRPERTGGRAGLIPAHAGKTAWGGDRSGAARAHPRSRGENDRSRRRRRSCWGSSPLTRGKRIPAPIRSSGPRLIPAHAGKTRVCPRRRRTCRAHPRSRGEN